MWQPKRSETLEIIDLGPHNYTQEEYSKCLHLLTQINKYLGGFRPILSSFIGKPETILDIGCGEGTLCHYLHKAFPEAKILGIDLSAAAITQAEAILPYNVKEKISFKVQKNKSLDYPNDHFDVVTSLLVCHHIPDKELVHFLQECHRICRKAVIINDLHRHFLAFLAFSLIAPLFFRNRLIESDGKLSIRRAFHKSDWIRLLEEAGFSPEEYVLKWHWPFRWTLTLRKK